MEMALSSSAISPNLRPPTSQSLLISSTSSSFFRPTSLLTRQAKNLALGRPKTRPRTNPGLSCTCLFGLGVPELVVIAGVAALVFGPKKLPEVGKSIGKTVKSFQQAAKEFESELKKEPEAGAEIPEGKVTEVSEEEKKDAEVSSTKEG
ncbi:sec-independent protein translocase protein TATA, chloroplastic [Daucus carota subsp. sativus]|nr:PREDICTED: sec-independent protein translocase protein TATA, chloroplastic-like [Daucus carota subsp. sativus]